MPTTLDIGCPENAKKKFKPHNPFCRKGDYLARFSVVAPDSGDSVDLGWCAGFLANCRILDDSAGITRSVCRFRQSSPLKKSDGGLRSAAMAQLVYAKNRLKIQAPTIAKTMAIPLNSKNSMF